MTTTTLTSTTAKSKRSIQTELVLHHIRSTGSITALEAWDTYSIRSLSRRITDIREEGYKILSTLREHPTTGQRYARYSFVDPANETGLPVRGGAYRGWAC